MLRWIIRRAGRENMTTMSRTSIHVVCASVVTSDKLSSRVFFRFPFREKRKICLSHRWRHALENSPLESSRESDCGGVREFLLRIFPHTSRALSIFTSQLNVLRRNHMFRRWKCSRFHSRSRFHLAGDKNFAFRTVQITVFHSSKAREGKKKSQNANVERLCVACRFRNFFCFSFLFGMLISLIRVRERIRL